MEERIIEMKRGMVWSVVGMDFHGDIVHQREVKVGAFVVAASDLTGWKIVFNGIEGGHEIIELSLGMKTRVVLDFGQYGRLLFCEKDRPGFGEYDPGSGEIGCYFRHEPSGLDRYQVSREWLVSRKRIDDIKREVAQ